MRSRRFHALAASAIAAAALAGCSSPESASTDQQFQMVRITEEMLDRYPATFHYPVVQLSASDDWGIMVYDYYLSHRDHIDQGQTFVKAGMEAPND
ncbi:MAG: hypothetical protein JSV91_13445 [Phycisphaerales bacterium]|nr:MAG: hypothetical protein JSV91_13445 [Phycisphaerales bacterium]